MARSSMGKRRRRSGDQRNAMSVFGRRYMIYLDRAGVRAGIKRLARRQERFEAKRNIKQGD